MYEFSCKWVVHALREHELHTLETFIIRLWAQHGYVTKATTFPESANIFCGSICSPYWRPINSGGTLVE